MQGSVGVKYDRKLNENVKMHATAIYSRSKRIHHKFEQIYCYLYEKKVLKSNLTTYSFHEKADFSLFLRTHAKVTDIFGLKVMFNIKPQVETKMMFEGSLGMEFRF